MKINVYFGVVCTYIPLRMLKQVVILVPSHFYLVFGQSIEKDISHNFHISYIESKYFEKDNTYHQDFQNVNNDFGLFVTHSFTNSNLYHHQPIQMHLHRMYVVCALHTYFI